MAGLSIVGTGRYPNTGGTPIASGTSKIFSLPTGYAAGDMLYLFIVHNDLTYPTTPTGWSITSRWTNAYKFALYEKLADGTEGTTVTVTTTNAFTLGGATAAVRKGASDTWNSPVSGQTVQFAESTFIPGDTDSIVADVANSGVVEECALIFHWATYNRNSITTLTLTPDGEESEGVVGYGTDDNSIANNYYKVAVTADVGSLKVSTENYTDTWVYNGSGGVIFKAWETVAVFPSLAGIQPPPVSPDYEYPYERRHLSVKALPYHLTTGITDGIDA